MTFDQALQKAVRHHERGELADAEGIYRQILAQAPHNADTLHLLGVLTHQMGRHAEGITLVQRAIAINPEARFQANLGELCRMAGRLQEAEAACLRAIQIDPNLPAAYHNLAATYEQLGRGADALEAARKGVGAAPRDASSRRIYGSALAMVGRKVEAARELEQALNLGPANGVGWLQLAAAFQFADRVEHAIYCTDRAVQLMPNAAPPRIRLAELLLARARYADALKHFQAITRLDPGYAELQRGIARCYEGLNRFDEAIQLCNELLAKDKSDFVAHSVIANARMQSRRLEDCAAGVRDALKISDMANLHQILAACYARMGRLDESLAEIDQAISMVPDYVIANFSKALILMFMGRLAEAWPYFEQRWRHPQMDAWRHVTDKPAWDGGPLNGKTILLYAEQGLGDTVQFARYAPMIRDLGGKVVVEVQKPLKELIGTINGVERAIARGEPVGHFDTLAPLCSLPGLFKTDLKTIPARVPYLTVPPQHIERIARLLPRPDGRLRVGIAWMGGDFQRENHLRSMTLAQFAPLAKVPGVQFFSLQKGPAAAEAANPPLGMDLVNLDSIINDFMDTAAVMMQLDLIISIDTSVVHVAGALALPAWNLLCLNIGHMWMQNRDDSPWYPTMRLFRQPVYGEWEPVMERIATELASLAAVRRP